MWELHRTTFHTLLHQKREILQLRDRTGEIFGTEVGRKQKKMLKSRPEARRQVSVLTNSANIAVLANLVETLLSLIVYFSLHVASF